MNISTQLYKQSLESQPQTGQHILAFQTEDQIVVYQAYKPSIAQFAVENQYLGGPDYNCDRMSWIKPNFLWMMYRCGWAEKENQERVLAIWIKKQDLETLLEQAVLSSFDATYYQSHDEWKNELILKEVRLQWDPDHDPYGNKQKRRAIQLGLKGETLNKFIKQIRLIEDITDFVKQQKQLLDNDRLEELLVPVETVFTPTNKELSKKIGLSM